MDVTSATWLDLPPSHKLISLFWLPLTSIDCHVCPIIIFLSINPTPPRPNLPYPDAAINTTSFSSEQPTPTSPSPPLVTTSSQPSLFHSPARMPPISSVAASKEESVLSQSGPIHITFRGCRHTVPTSPKTQKYEPALSHILFCIHICAS